ncbi:SpoIIE family protein phosphatase [Streptomyces sp. NPDC003456]|uniref:SpoIIE family protein phosphatase n=1 Tax=Streptomyces sp. NPDC003456 TaxID=3364683 RepID=UPI0036791D88
MGAIPTQRETASRAEQAPAPARGPSVPAGEGLTEPAAAASVGEGPAAHGGVAGASAATARASAPTHAQASLSAQAQGQASLPVQARAHATLPGSSLAPGAARSLLRAAFAEWAETGLPAAAHLTERLAADARLVVSELVTNAVVHAGTVVELECRLEGDVPDTAALVVEVRDHHPSRAPRGAGPDPSAEPPEHGRGLRLVGALSESWGITYRAGSKTVWARLPAAAEEEARARAEAQAAAYAGEHAGEHALARDLRFAENLAPEPPGSAGSPGPGERAGRNDAPDLDGPSRQPAPAGPEERRQRYEEQDGGWLGRGALSFLAEASDLLAGQLDEDLVAALTGQLIVPRLADWCAMWMEDEATGGWSGADGPGLTRVWHRSEHRVEELRRALEKEPPQPSDPSRPGPAAHPWPGEALGGPGAALAYRLVAGGRPLGTLVIGRTGTAGFPDEITGLVEDLSRRVALAVGAARRYARQATISAVLQRGLLPGAVAEIPGVRSALVYEPCDKGGPSGDFYDLFPAGDGRWCFAVGDVQGKGPEAAVVIGLARPWLRLLAREGYRVADVLDRLNQLLLDDATEAADAAARALVAAGARPTPPGDGPQTRFLSLLYGELVPFDGGVHCTVASAGHPLPLLLGAGGEVQPCAQPQTLLGVVEDATYTSESFDLRAGDTLLCVTDGVTERRSGSRQFDDGDGLAAALAGCAGLRAELIAERIQQLVHDFGERPPADDLALLVLQAE